MSMDRNDISKIIRRVFLGVIGCIVVYWLLHDMDRVSSIYHSILNMLSPFIVGAVLAFILNVPMRAIEGKLTKIANPKLRRIIALTLSFVGLLLILTGVCWLLIPELIDTIKRLTEALPTFVTETKDKLLKLLEDRPELQAAVMENVDLSSFDWTAIIDKISAWLLSFVGSAFTFVGSFFTFIFNAFISVVFAVYCLCQKETLAQQGRKLAYAFLPEKAADEVVRVLRLANSTFSNFLSGQCIEVVILGCMFAVSMAICGMDYIPLVSVLVAVTAFIPVVGAWIGCIVGSFLMLISGDISQAFGFVLLSIVVQQIENHLVYPRVVGSSIGLSGMWVLVGVSLGGSIMGVAGMFLMIPMVSVLYTLLGEITHKRLEKRHIDPDKLRDHPPVLKSKIKEKISKKRAVRAKTITVRKKDKQDSEQ